jgi:DNA topoisomerase IB
MQTQMELELPGVKRVQAATAPMKASTQEIGYAQAVNYDWWRYEDETTPELVWPQSVSVFDAMRRTDAQVASVLRAVNLPVRRTQWRIDPNGARATVVKFVANDLGLPIVGKGPLKSPSRTKGKFSWQEHLRLALLELVYGHMYFEQVYAVNAAGTEAHLKKLAPRMPKTLERIDVAPDGGLVSITQLWTKTDVRPQAIPVDRLVAYVHDREGGNWLGQSILRPAYKNWLIKDRLLRVQAQTIERNGMGIPLYMAQENASTDDLTAGKAMATAWRAGEAAGSAIPYGANLVLRGVEGTLPDADPAIRYHDEQIARAVLAHFLNLGTQTGSWALGATFADFFVFSLQTLAQQIADITTQHVIEDLVDLNFGPDEPAPKLVFDEIGSQQAATAQALKLLVDAGVIHPDQILEESSRQQYGLPPADPATATTPPAAAGSGSAEPVATPSERPGSVAAAAGLDTHPGGEELKHYWVYGEGAAKWKTWTELEHHLLKYLAEGMAKRTAAAWFHLRYGYWPGDQRNLHAKFNPAELRDPGGEGGGRWVRAPGAGAAEKVFDGMHKASTRDRENFREEVGKAIPPAWTDVHIADDLATARILARGRDAKGRGQTMYSAAHTEAQAAAKFVRIRELSGHLDGLDEAVERDAPDDDSAAALLLIRRLGMRPGSERDTGAEKAAHGATNLRARHVTVDGDDVHFDFVGKKGVHITVSTTDPLMAEVLRSRLAKRSGDERLFDTTEDKTRAYMRSAGVPAGFLLKDLRTVRANTLALREIAARGNATPRTKTEYRRWRKMVGEAVSAQLGNTPDMALSSYINPAVFAPWQQSEDWV